MVFASLAFIGFSSSCSILVFPGETNCSWAYSQYLTDLLLHLEGSWLSQMDSCIVLPMMIGLEMGMCLSQAIQNHRINSVTFAGTFRKEACFSTGVAEKIEYKPKAAGSHLVIT